MAAYPDQEASRIRSELTRRGIYAHRGRCGPGRISTVSGAYTATRKQRRAAARDGYNRVSPWARVMDVQLGSAAAALPVVAFVVWPVGTARVVSVMITSALLVVLGLRRAQIAHTTVLRTVVETVGVAAAAVIAGWPIGSFVNPVVGRMSTRAWPTDM